MMKIAGDDSLPAGHAGRIVVNIECDGIGLFHADPIIADHPINARTLAKEHGWIETRGLNGLRWLCPVCLKHR
jgi:hypothetical protein